MTTKRNLANCILKAHEIHEASYNSETYTYSVCWTDAICEACAAIDPDLEEIVSGLCTASSGGFYCETYDWAERHKG